VRAARHQGPDGRRGELPIPLREGCALPHLLPWAGEWVRGPPARIRKGIEGFSWEGFALPNPSAGGRMGKPGFPIPLPGGGVGKPGFPTPLAEGLCSR